MPSNIRKTNRIKKSRKSLRRKLRKLSVRSIKRNTKRIFKKSIKKSRSNLKVKKRKSRKVMKGGTITCRFCGLEIIGYEDGPEKAVRDHNKKCPGGSQGGVPGTNIGSPVWPGPSAWVDPRRCAHCGKPIKGFEVNQEEAIANHNKTCPVISMPAWPQDVYVSGFPPAAMPAAPNEQGEPPTDDAAGAGNSKSA